MWKSGSSFQENVTIWWEILYFSIKKYIRNSGKCNYLPGKNTFFPDLIENLHAHTYACRVENLTCTKKKVHAFVQVCMPKIEHWGRLNLLAGCCGGNKNSEL